MHIFRIVLAKYPIDLVQGCSLAVNSLFSAIVVHLDFGTLVTKEVGMQFSSSAMFISVLLYLQASLNLVDSFIKACILPQKTVFDLVVWCLIACLPMMLRMLAGNKQ